LGTFLGIKLIAKNTTKLGDFP